MIYNPNNNEKLIKQLYNAYWLDIVPLFIEKIFSWYTLLVQDEQYVSTR